MITQSIVPHVSEDNWERHKATIRKLYLEENKTLDEVIEVMNEAYGFVSAYKPSFGATYIHSYLSSKSNYERRIRRWKFRKNHAASEWEAVVQRVQSRDRDGKKSNVYIDTRSVSSEKLQRKVALYCSGPRFGIETSGADKMSSLLSLLTR
jgi:Clr5 domain